MLLILASILWIIPKRSTRRIIRKKFLTFDKKYWNHWSKIPWYLYIKMNKSIFVQGETHLIDKQNWKKREISFDILNMYSNFLIEKWRPFLVKILKKFQVNEWFQTNYWNPTFLWQNSGIAMSYLLVDIFTWYINQKIMNSNK